MPLLLLAQLNLQLFKGDQTTEDPICSVSTVRRPGTPWTDVIKSMATPPKHRIEGVEAISMCPTGKLTIPGHSNLHRRHSLLRQKCRLQICQDLTQIKPSNSTIF